MKRPQVVAHRGSSARHADNSWAAFEAAVAEGADAIECDVQATRDGILVIRHDLLVDERAIVDSSAADIEARTGALVTLQQLLAWAAPAAIELLVEIKDPDVAAAVADAIAKSAMRDRCVIASFDALALATVRGRWNDATTSFMMGSVVDAGALVHLARSCQANGVHLCWENRAPRPHRLVDRAMFGLLRDADLAITLWHEEREGELRALVALGPDAICSNTPAALRRIVDMHCAAGADAGEGGGGATVTTTHPADGKQLAQHPKR
ncbi:MAG: glycerophosphodiester phosphodiesterase [Betaproteobacteria bacterium]